MQNAQSGDPVPPPAGACEVNPRGIEGEHWAQCARVRRYKKNHTLTVTTSKMLSVEG